MVKTIRLLPCCLAAVLTAAEPGAAPASRWTPSAWASDQYESHPTFTPDGQEAFFMRSDRNFANYRILHSRLVDGVWSRPSEPAFAGPAGVLEGDPFLSADGRQLLFLSSRHGLARGRGNDDLDIWRVERREDGTWGEAQRLPEPVNSDTSELFPRLLADGRLVFGSHRSGGAGGVDIWFATPQSDGSWRVENAGPAINSPGDEYEAEVSRDLRTLILVARRPQRSHLYRYELVRGVWEARGQIAAFEQVFQTGPLLSPKGDRLLFAQADAERSGEIFLLDLSPQPDRSWPPGTEAAPARREKLH